MSTKSEASPHSADNPGHGANAIARVVYVIDKAGRISGALERLPPGRAIFVRSFPSSRQFLEAAHDMIPGPIVVDLDTAGAEAQLLLDQVHQKRLRWPVILLDGHGDVNVAVGAMKLGASDFLDRPLDADRVETMFHDAFALLDEGASARADSVAAHARLAKLTRRQVEVLTGLMGGLSNKQVAYRLSISSRTVEMHRAAALNRLGVRTVAEVVTLKSADVEPPLQ